MKPKRKYHHGDLKRALLDAALELTRAVGSEGFTLRQVAARAGVSHTALYRHFRNKEELLAAVATEGYNYLGESMVKAMASGETAYERLRLNGRGFTQFAVRYPEHFKVIFDYQRRYDYPETNEAGERTFGLLIQAVEQCQTEGIVRQGNPRLLALMYLAVAVGVAKSAITGRLPFSKTAEVVAFDEMVKGALTRGLAPEPPQHPVTAEKPGKEPVARSGPEKKKNARR